MRVEKSEKSITIFLTGDIDALNAMSVQREIEEILTAQGDSKLIFDARELAYISSAGLRILLTIQKNQPGKISIINISDDVLDIFRMAGFQHFILLHNAQRLICIGFILPLIETGGGFFTLRLLLMTLEETIQFLLKSIIAFMCLYVLVYTIYVKMYYFFCPLYPRGRKSVMGCSLTLKGGAAS